MDELIIALFLAVANKSIVDYLAAPIRQKYPKLDLWWLVYVALATGGFIGWFSGVNLFAAYIPVPELGRILTAILVGGGSSLIYDVFDRPG